MALPVQELSMLDRLHANWSRRQKRDELLLGYREGTVRIQHLGMAIPPELRKFVVFINWCDTVVTSHTDRQQIRSLVMPGEEEASDELHAIADTSNLDTVIEQEEDDVWTFGRSFLSVGANDERPQHPLIRAESPREMSAVADMRSNRLLGSARFYGQNRHTLAGPSDATLYMPNATTWLTMNSNRRWVVVDRDEHNLGRVPVVMNVFRRRSGRWTGKPGIRIVIPLVDSVTRTMTMLQFGQEAAGLPDKYMTGVDQGDFVDKKTGKPIPRFEAYFNAIKMVRAADGKVGQLAAADLKNFETSFNVNAKAAAALTKLPADYFGVTTANPASEGNIRGTESRMIRSVESMNRSAGEVVGWAMELAWRIRPGGEWPDGRIGTDWFDPATPTIGQRMDAVVKAHSEGLLSREGAWDELGWSKARKDKERARFAEESVDAVDQAILDGLAS